MVGFVRRVSRSVRAGCALYVLLLTANATAAPVVPTLADGFVDSVGVNVHATHYLGFPTTTYDDWPSVVQAVKTLGVRNVRDHIFDTDRLNQITAATGAKVTAIMDWHTVVNGKPTLDPTKLPDLITLAKQLTGLAALEGPSEYEQFAPPGWEDGLRSWQQSLYAAAKADSSLKNIPVLAPTPGFYSPDFADLAPYSDRGNMHSYPYYPLSVFTGWAATVSGGKAVWSTETGATHAANSAPSNIVSLTSAAKTIPRLLMDHYNAGVERTFLYELVNDNVDPGSTNHENHFGLFNTDFSLKPAGLAVRNLLALLADPAAAGFTPTALDYTVTGGNANLRQTLLQKRDGTYWLALWQDVSVYDDATNTDLVNPDLAITLNFANTMPGAAVYLPDGSTAPLATYGPLSQLSLNVPDKVMIVQIVPEPSTGLVILGAAAMLLRRRRRRAA